MNVVLCGMPASGKTTVCNYLKKLSDMQAVDTDALIVEKHGKIAKIFEEFGEERFRQIETEICKALTNCQNLIIATGGGCVLREQNVNFLKANGKIFYLKAKFETLLSRLQGDTSRPLLKGDLKQNLFALYSARSAVYESVADYIIQTDQLSPKQVANQILNIIKGDF